MITGFNPAQIIGLLFYILLLPLWLPLWLIFRDAVELPPPAASGLAQPRPNWPALPLCTAALVGWLILYSEATSFREVSLGVILCGALLLLLAYRALQRTKPLTYMEVSILGTIERIGSSMANAATENEKKKPVSKRVEAATNLKIYGLSKDMLLMETLFIRGKRGRDRIYMFVLVEYVMFLLILGLVAILFWGLVAKAATAPRPMSLLTLLYFSAPHFLPGVQAPAVPSSLPLWAQVGPAVTAWVLFVVFVGPAASLVPLRQGAYGTRLTATYVVCRRSVVLLCAYLRRMEKLKRTLA